MGDEKRLDNVRVCITCELGRKELGLKEIRGLQERDVITLDKLAGEAVEVRMNGRLFARGETVVVADVMAVRITDMERRAQEVEA